jgi:hypothetical protein
LGRSPQICRIHIKEGWNGTWKSKFLLIPILQPHRFLGFPTKMSCTKFASNHVPLVPPPFLFYSTLQSRMSTYGSWPLAQHFLTPTEFAKAGFHYIGKLTHFLEMWIMYLCPFGYGIGFIGHFFHWVFSAVTVTVHKNAPLCSLTQNFCRPAVIQFSLKLDWPIIRFVWSVSPCFPEDFYSPLRPSMNRQITISCQLLGWVSNEMELIQNRTK